MMTPFKILTENEAVEQWLENPATGERYGHPKRYDARVDIEQMQYAYAADIADNDPCRALPTLCECIDKGILEDKRIYQTHRIQLGYIKTLTKAGMDRIKNYFKAKGYEVTDSAIRYLWENWQSDHKSGYRDEGNRHHLFCPCGCNPFSVTLTSLPQGLTLDWQKTYCC